MTTKTNKTRTYGRNRGVRRKPSTQPYESDGKYFLKLVLCVVLGTVWLKFNDPILVGPAVFNGLPIGLFVGLLVVSQFEKFQYDRKIWYAILVIVTIVSYFLPSGIII